MALGRAKAATGNHAVIDDATSLLDELAARFPQVQERQPGDVDADMLAKRRSISRISAARILFEAWKSGELDRVLVRGERWNKYVYRRKAITK